MEDEGMKITVVGVLAIAGVVALLILLAQYLRNRGENGPTGKPTS